MKVQSFNGCKVYNLSSGAVLPSFMTENRKRKLAKSDEYSKRIELIQDFDMPIACTRVRFCADGEHILAVGTYPPCVKCFTTSDMSQKFGRGLTSDVVTFECLGDDFGKLIFLHVDRYLSFHAPYGKHYQLRIPRHGRDMVYATESCEAMVGGEGSEVYRLNLEMGVFKKPLELSFSGCNKLAANPGYPLLAAGGSGNLVDFFDTRARDVVATLSVPYSPSCKNPEVTALKFDAQGLVLGVGTSEGHCLLYDVRSSRPLYTKEHQFGFPVLDVTFHHDSGMVLSSDKKVVKIWDQRGSGPHGKIGQVLTNIETTADINGVELVRDRRGDSGLICIAGEQERIMNYFVPDLGPAPRWCSHLEGITEELEESRESTVYEDFKFVTRQEVEEIGAEALIGTSILRAYMHGFFMDMKLYSKLRAASKPFEYDEYRKAKIKEKIEAKRESRISVRKRTPKVNADLAEKLERRAAKSVKSAKDTDEYDEGGGGGVVEGGVSGVDSRFSALFERPEFQQDKESAEYKLRNPTASAHSAGGSGKRARRNGDDEDLYGGDDDDDDDDDDDGLGGMFERVDEDDDDDMGDVDEQHSGTEGENDHEHWSDDSLDAVRYEEEDEAEKSRALKSAKRKQRGTGKGSRAAVGGDDDEEGVFARVSRKMKEARRQREVERKQSSLAKAGKSKSKSKGMYEIGTGESDAQATFAHSAEALEKRQREAAMRGAMVGERAAAAKAEAGRSQAQIRTIRGKEGVVREMSYIPKDTGKKGKKSKSSKKDGLGAARRENRDSMERAASMGSGAFDDVDMKSTKKKQTWR